MTFYVEGTDNIFTLKGRRNVAKFLNDLTRTNRTRRVKSILNNLDLSYRQKIVHLKVNRRPLLFEATLVGNLKLVNYLLEECEANIEQTGFCETAETTCLWQAASRNFIQIVVSLVEHGADVNTRGINQRTAVSIACQNPKMVLYLVDHGADIHTPDGDGRTCLIYSVHSAKTCELLLQNGSDVNQTDNKGKDALYFAIRKGYVESVKVLVEGGADILRVGPKQNTPLELSAVGCLSVIVEYLISINCYPGESAANAYELLGSKLFMEDLPKAKLYWEKALQIRNQENLFPKLVPEHRSHQFVEIPLGKEFETQEELNEISRRMETMWTQALLIQLRILGQKHSDTINSFSEKILYHVSQLEFESGIALLKCLFLFYATHNDPLPLSLLLMISMLKVLANRIVETDSRDVEHSHNLICLVTHYVSLVGMDFVGSLNPADHQNKMMEFEMYLIEILTQLDYLLSFHLTEEQHNKLNVSLYNLIRQQPQGPGRVGLLHLTIRLQLSPRLLSRLIQCGADVNSQDALGNSVFHDAIHRHLSSKKADILSCLLDHGCHVDIRDNYGYCPLEYLRTNGILRNPLGHITLQCMAAKVIKKRHIPYRKTLSKDLCYFVDSH